MLFVTNCSTIGEDSKTEPAPVIIDTACKWVDVILISEKDVFTNETARQILRHNKTVVKNCPQLDPSATK